MHISIVRDEGKIKCAWDDSHTARVGWDRITKIAVYGENGDMAYIPWVAVYRDDVIWQRFRVAGVQYEVEEDNED